MQTQGLKRRSLLICKYISYEGRALRVQDLMTGKIERRTSSPAIIEKMSNDQGQTFEVIVDDDGSILSFVR